MDPGYRSPLVDLFLTGGATRDVRLLAARGLLPRPAQEQIALLVVLVDDPDPDIAAIADTTISRLPQAALQELRRVAGSQLDAELVEVFCDLVTRNAVEFRHSDDADFEAELQFERRVREYARPQQVAASG